MASKGGQVEAEGNLES